MSKALAAAGPVLAPTWRESFAGRVGRGGDELSAILPLAARRYMITSLGGFPAPLAFPVDDVRELAEEPRRSVIDRRSSP